MLTINVILEVCCVPYDARIASRIFCFISTFTCKVDNAKWSTVLWTYSTVVLYKFGSNKSFALCFISVKDLYFIGNKRGGGKEIKIGKHHLP